MSRRWLWKQRPAPTHDPAHTPSDFRRGDQGYADTEEEEASHSPTSREALLEYGRNYFELHGDPMASRAHSSRHHPYAKTPVKQGPGGPSPNTSPVKDTGEENVEEVNMESEDGPEPFDKQNSGVVSERNPNNSAKVTTVLRPLTTQEWTVNFEHRRCWDIINVEEGNWTTVEGIGIKKTDYHCIPDRAIGHYIDAVETIMIQQMMYASTQFRIRHAGWKVKSVQLYTLNVLDPGAIKYVNSNNQDPYLYMIKDIHDIPVVHGLAGLNDATYAPFAQQVNQCRQAQFKPQQPYLFRIDLSNFHRPNNTAADGWIPYDRLIQLDKDSFVTGGGRKLVTWDVPFMSMVQTAVQTTDTFIRGPATCGDGTQTRRGYFPTKMQMNTAPTFTTQQDAVAWITSYPVGPMCFSDMATINPFNGQYNMPSKCNIPWLCKIQDIRNPDGTYVDIHMEVVVESDLVMEFSRRGFSSNTAATQVTQGVFNYQGHVLCMPPVDSTNMGAMVQAMENAQRYTHNPYDYTSVGTVLRQAYQGSQCPAVPALGEPIPCPNPSF